MKILEDEKIVGLFFERNEKALRETEASCGALLRKTAKAILESDSDVEECLNDTLLSLWQNIPPAVPKSLRAYACKVIRNLAFKRLEYGLALKRSINSELPLDELEAVLFDLKTENEFSDVEFTLTLDSFLGSLSAESRAVFLKRYFFCDTVPQIAQDLCISESKVNSLLYRARKKLRSVYEKGAEL